VTTSRRQTTRAARYRDRQTRGDRGSASVEVTIAAPLLVLLLLAVVQFAVWAHAMHIAQAAANTGVQTARAHGSTAHGGKQDTATILDQLAGRILTNRTVTAQRTATDATVTVSGTAQAVIPGLALPVRVSVTAPREKVPGTP
jgi:Flp pilus assembly protein TadG